MFIHNPNEAKVLILTSQICSIKDAYFPDNWGAISKDLRPAPIVKWNRDLPGVRVVPRSIPARAKSKFVAVFPKVFTHRNLKDNTT